MLRAGPGRLRRQRPSRTSRRIDSLLFALALAVGLTPELLPAIISITLAHGAQRMAGAASSCAGSNSIENFGSMDVLCTDKTGTLTEGVVRLDGALDARRASRPRTSCACAYLNAHFQTGLANPLDEAICAHAGRPGWPAACSRRWTRSPTTSCASA